MPTSYQTLGSIALFALLAACGGTSVTGAEASPDAGGSTAPDASVKDSAPLAPVTRIYATVVSHNEQDSNAACKQGINHDAAKYAANRTLLKTLIDGVVARKAAYDQQNDFAYLDAMESYETPDLKAQTGGKNILAYAAGIDPDRVSVDVHHHVGGLGNDENWADVAARLNALGVPDNGVVGGFLYSPSANAEVDAMRGYATSGVVSLKTWNGSKKTWFPTILWGGGTAGHGSDSEASGVWRPSGNNAFYTDDPGSNLPNVGHYHGNLDFSGPADLVQMYKAGQLEAGKMYTVTFMLNQCEFTEASVNALLAAIDQYAGAVAEGYFVWKTLPGIVSDWRSVYGATSQMHFGE